MDINFGNAFGTAGIEILKTEVNATATQGEISTGTFTTYDLNINIGIIGKLEGHVFYGCSLETGYKFIGAMTGEAYTEYSDIIGDGLSELANVITGRASIGLEKQGIHFDLSPPTLLKGQGTQVTTRSIPIIGFPLTTPMGTLHIHIGVRKSAG